MAKRSNRRYLNKRSSRKFNKKKTKGGSNNSKKQESNELETCLIKSDLDKIQTMLNGKASKMLTEVNQEIKKMGCHESLKIMVAGTEYPLDLTNYKFFEFKYSGDSDRGSGSAGKKDKQTSVKAEKRIQQHIKQYFVKLKDEVPDGESVIVTLSDKSDKASIVPFIIDSKSDIESKVEVINLNNISGDCLKVLRHLLPETKYRELYEKHFEKTTEMDA